MSLIKLALPKGSLQESTFALFQRAGWSCSVSSRSYTPSIDDPDISARLLRPQEIARYIKLGLIDAGIAGYDWIYENGARLAKPDEPLDGADLVEIAELNYSKSTSNPVRWVIAVPEDSPIQSVQDLQGKRIATEAVGLTTRFLEEHGVKADVEYSFGATEVKAPELVDAIVDLTETGSSLRANHLRILETILVSTTRFVASVAAWQDPAKRAKLEQIAMLLCGSLLADSKSLLKMNARRGDLAAVSAILPSLRAPTVNTLADPAWVAIEAVVDEKDIRHIIPLLRKAGASGIVALRLSRVFPD